MSLDKEVMRGADALYQVTEHSFLALLNKVQVVLYDLGGVYTCVCVCVCVRVCVSVRERDSEREIVEAGGHGPQRGHIAWPHLEHGDLYPTCFSHQ